MKFYLPLIALLSASSVAAADVRYAGAPDCRVVEHARVAGQAAYWSGACRDGYADGPGALQWSKDGKPTERYEGPLAKGLPEGAGIAQWADGSLHKGTYQGGQLHGPAAVVFKSGTRLEANFEHGKLVGNVKATYAGGNRYEGSWRNGPEGTGTMTFALGGAYSGPWIDGKPFGDGEIRYPNGQVLKARFNGSFQLTQRPQPETPKLYNIKREDPQTGSNIRPVLGNNFIVPPEKPYAELTPDQQALVKSFYEILQEDDAPPYPEKGMVQITRAMGKLISYGHIEGILRANVSINEAGVPQSVTVLKSPDSEAAKLAGSILMLIKYTPGRCAGQPCAMMVPFNYSLSVK
ncbi:hypothetical protein [Janthinobacterium sp. RB2R34]|uniref:hypothetical protein n=1 Tax=Janthinobacterium sp. RB2R34 TaxID=3424193 RepID=UPI003F27052F